MGKIAWLDWITEKGVFTTDFLQQARKRGIVRQVNRQNLGAMSWGDVVYCISLETTEKRGAVFCKFPLTQVTGLEHDAYKLIVASLESAIIDPGGDFQKTRRGTVCLGATARIQGTIQDICTCLEKVGALGYPLGDLAIGCESSEFSVMELPWPRLSRVAKVQGYRQFDALAMEADLEALQQSKPGKINLVGTYRAQGKPTGAVGGQIQWQNDYGSLPVSEAQAEFAFTFSEGRTTE